MAKQRIHLVAKAHIDPVWEWQWDEGAAEAVSTFRTAADFLEEFPEFIFCHNESALYQWVEEFEPALFKRIAKLVKANRWHIMGGWVVQPDCNIPSGESFVRQGLLGKTYFREKFGVDVRSAVNFDSFGHTRGLVQILAKSGYDIYVLSRPAEANCHLPDDAFVWVGYDGSEILGFRLWQGYGSVRGGARAKIEAHMKSRPDRPVTANFWGIGNHGGGPSRIDLENLRALTAETKDAEIKHSTPDAFVKDLQKIRGSLGRVERDLNMWAPGCYTSQIRIKQKHRELENELYLTEKMASAAWLQGLMEYPQADFNAAAYDMLFSEFHDVMGGTSIQPGEEDILRMLDHGLELVARQKMKAMCRLSAGQPRAKQGVQPMLVFNPHPWPVRALVEGEFNLPDQNWNREIFHNPVITRNGKPVTAQYEKEKSAMLLDWRKRAIMDTVLEPGMNRFDCCYEVVKRDSLKVQLKEKNGAIRFKNADMEVVINTRTGLVDRYKVGGADYVKKNAFLPLVIKDNADPWGANVDEFREAVGKFELMTGEAAKKFTAVEADLPSVRVVEDGAVRSIVEAIFSYGDSFICQRYKLPKQGTMFEVESRVYWNEKHKMLKLSIPSTGRDHDFIGQVAYGKDHLLTNGKEAVAQKWVAVVSKSEGRALTCVNDGTYGCSFEKGELRVSMLRSVAYSALPVGQPVLVLQDRYTPCAEQGERLFHFWINAGEAKERLEAIDREAIVLNEKPYFLAFYPSGEGKKPKAAVTLSDPAVQVGAVKKSEVGNDLVIRLFEPTGKKRKVKVAIPAIGASSTASLGAFEIKTYRVNAKTKKVKETNLVEM